MFSAACGAIGVQKHVICVILSCDKKVKMLVYFFAFLVLLSRFYSFSANIFFGITENMNNHKSVKLSEFGNAKVEALMI